MKFEASTQIDAPPSAVWAVLTDISKWPEWDPFCDRIEGELVQGKKVKAFSKLSPGRAFPVKVAVLEPDSKMVWRGGMPLGLFKGERTFSLTPAGAGTQFEMREEFSGLMLGLIKKSLPDMSAAFEAFCAGLKARTEQSV